MPVTKRKTKASLSGRYVTIYLDQALYRQFLREALARKSTVGKIIKEVNSRRLESRRATDQTA